MRKLVIALAALLWLSPSWAGDAPDPVLNAFSYFEDARPEMSQPAIDLLIEKGDAARLAQMRRSTSTLDRASDSHERVAYDGVAYGLDVARRYASAELGSVTSWMTLDELMRSGWRAHVGAVLRRAGLTSRKAAQVLAERAQAELACQELLSAALGDAKVQDLAVAEAARQGTAIVPHALAVLAIPPWIVFAGWPEGTTVMQQRLAVRVLTALKARVAIPYLLVHVDAPSAMLQFDVLHALAQLTEDATWEGRDPSKLQDLAKQRLAWWKREGKGHAEGARWFALSGLKVAGDFVVSAWLTAKPALGAIDESPNPVVHLFGCLEWLTGYPVPDQKSADPLAFEWSLQIADAIRHFQGLD